VPCPCALSSAVAGVEMLPAYKPLLPCHRCPSCFCLRKNIHKRKGHLEWFNHKRTHASYRFTSIHKLETPKDEEALHVHVRPCSCGDGQAAATLLRQAVPLAVHGCLCSATCPQRCSCFPCRPPAVLDAFAFCHLKALAVLLCLLLLPPQFMQHWLQPLAYFRPLAPVLAGPASFLLPCLLLLPIALSVLHPSLGSRFLLPLITPPAPAPAAAAALTPSAVPCQEPGMPACALLDPSSQRASKWCCSTTLHGSHRTACSPCPALDLGRLLPPGWRSAGMHSCVWEPPAPAPVQLPSAARGAASTLAPALPPEWPGRHWG